jgi:hypothetical protein
MRAADEISGLSRPAWFSGDFPLDRERMLVGEFDGFDAAPGWPRHLSAGGRVPLPIEGDDGTRRDKQDIAAAVLQAGQA